MRPRRDASPWDEARYRAWRATIPFTDDAIATCLERLAQSEAPNDYIAARYRHSAAYVRQGHLTRQILGQVLADLVAVCSLCGRPALYRYGSHGRCRAHKDEVPAFIRQGGVLREARATGHEQARRDFERSCALRDARARFAADKRRRS